MSLEGHSDEYPEHMFPYKKWQKNIIKIIFVSMIVNYSSVEMTDNQGLGLMEKNSTDDILKYFSYFSLGIDNALFL